MKHIWIELVQASSPYLAHQASQHHFEFYGLDYIANEDGQCYLIEVNRLPGLESSSCNKIQEDMFYDTMMMQLLKRVVVTQPLDSHSGVPTGGNNGDNSSTTTNDSNSDTTSDSVDGYNDDWIQVCSASTVNKDLFQSSKTWINTFKWKAYTKRMVIRSQVVLPIEVDI